jgi:signal transduction histidine kinase
MASAPDAELSVELLRTKYAELARKYAQLVERIEHRATHDLAAYRIGALDSRIAASALALVGDDRIQLTNARFVQLARLLKGPLLPVEPAGVALPYPDLRALVLAHADQVIVERKPAFDARYRDAASDALISLHFERNLQLGKPVALVIAEDVTDHARRDQELARTREAMLHRERLRVLGELAAAIAHDLGNTLRGASFQLAILGDDAAPHEKRAEAVQAVGQRVELASEAIARLHDFAQTGSLRTAAVRLDRVVAQAAALVEIDFQAAAAPVSIRVSVPELPPVRGSAAELSLLFVNLLRNARDAMPEGGTVTIAARRKNDSLVVTVADEGIGISPEVKRRLFEPFFTTKGSHGTGLGLWLAAGTMQRLGGSIETSDRPRRGALFVLTFPLKEFSRPRRPSAARRAARRRGPSGPASGPRGRARRA